MATKTTLIVPIALLAEHLLHSPLLRLPASKLALHWHPIQQLMNSGGLAEIDSLLRSDERLMQLNADFAEDI